MKREIIECDRCHKHIPRLSDSIRIKITPDRTEVYILNLYNGETWSSVPNELAFCNLNCLTDYIISTRQVLHTPV